MGVNRRTVLLGAVAAAGAAGLAPAAHASTGGGADLVIRGGRVLVLDRRFRVAEAIAVRGDRVVAVGRDNGEQRRLDLLEGAAPTPRRSGRKRKD